MEALADAVRLRMPGLGLGMFDAIYAKVQFVIVCFDFAAVLRPPVRQHTDNAHFQ